MKKKFLYTAIFAAMIGLASCNEDFNADVAAPQTWEQGEILAASGMTITPAADINLETVTEDSVILFSYQVNNQVEGSKIENLTAYVSKQDVEEWRKIEVDAEGKASVEVLQKTIEDLYGKKDEMRTLVLKAEASMNIDGEALFLSAEKVSVNITPKKPLIIPEYYIVGNIQGWNTGTKSCALYPVNLEESIFTYTTDFSNNNAGTPNFKIWAAADFGNWDNAIGTQIDGDTNLEGKLVQGNVGAIQTPDNGIYTLTLNLIEMKYEMVKEENQSVAEYTSIGLVGGFNGWNQVDNVQLIKAAPHNWYISNFTVESESELKFNADKAWTVSWGAGVNLGDTPFGKADLNGANFKLPAGTYDVFFNDITGQFAFFAR